MKHASPCVAFSLWTWQAYCSDSASLQPAPNGHIFKACICMLLLDIPSNSLLQTAWYWL